MTSSSDISAGALIAVDWGTSKLRAMLVGADGGPIEEKESDQGIGAIAGGHEAVFERLVARWPKAPAIMAGMVGSRQGWREADYVPCPAAPATLAERLLRFTTASGRPVAIVPGIVLRDAGRDGDAIRGEETQVVGLLARGEGLDGVAILPGTHSKWVRTDKGTITDFQTFLSGEMFDLLARHSFLRHSVAADGRELSEAPDFALAVRRIGGEGLPFLAAIFSVRARQLLDGVEPADNLAYLSGLVIGGEIAAARSLGRLPDGGPIHIIGAKPLARAYQAALGGLGVATVCHDGRDLVLGGLVHLARTSGFAMLQERS